MFTGDCADQNLSREYKSEVSDPTVTTLRDLLPTLVEELPEIIDEVVGLLREEWPDYAEFLAEDSRVVTDTAEAALHHLVALAETVPAQRDGERPEQSPTATALFEEVGRIEWREGRALGTLLSAYRAGARVAWRHMSLAALRRRVQPEAIALLAEAVFVFVEELSSASARGYVQEQLATAAERERMRAELADLLMSERSELPVINATALRAGWPLPSAAALVVVDPSAQGAHELLSRLDSSALPVRRPDLTGAIVADPDGPGRRVRLAEALRGLGAVVSTAVPPSLLPSTVSVAATAARLQREGVLTDDPVFVSDHYDALLVHNDPRLLALLSEQVLQPLAGLPAGTRGRLEETLTAWLTALGDQQTVARLLHVHPQTVRYRLGRLRQLYGAALDEPATRLRLMLALCWRQAGQRIVEVDIDGDGRGTRHRDDGCADGAQPRPGRLRRASLEPHG